MAAGVADPFGLVGSLFADRFTVEAVVAEGGFGVVYRARQRGLQRAVALKVLKLAEELSPRTRTAVFEAFRREARIVAELGHPAIVQVIDFDLTPTPSGVTAPWMALEWLDGETLDMWLDARRGQWGMGSPTPLPSDTRPRPPPQAVLRRGGLCTPAG